MLFMKHFKTFRHQYRAGQMITSAWQITCVRDRAKAVMVLGVLGSILNPVVKVDIS